MVWGLGFKGLLVLIAREMLKVRFYAPSPPPHTKPEALPQTVAV